MIDRVITAFSLSVLLAAPAAAQVLVDYRDGEALAMADTAQWGAIAEKIGGEVEVLGEVRGSFTAAGADEVAYLVSDGAPVAAEPFPELNQRLVVFAGEQQMADWAIPEAAFSRPVTAVDLDGDGISEVIVEGSFYNMGTLALGVSAIKVGQVPEIIQSLPDVYVDSCEAGVGEKGITASAISVSDGQLVAETETLECP
jgi:hypothetical protein